jgi:hypothetical protein
MTITTKEAERFARWCDTDGFTERATAIRSLAAERDALRAEVERLKAGGCARGQSTTQFCAEAVALQAENARLREALHEIECSHIPDQPAAFEHSDLDWARLHVGKLRSIARVALGEKDNAKA